MGTRRPATSYFGRDEPFPLQNVYLAWVVPQAPTDSQTGSPVSPTGLSLVQGKEKGALGKAPCNLEG